MKRRSYNNPIETAFSFIRTGVDKQLLHLQTNPTQQGRLINFNHQSLRNFGSYSYLGLEQDERLASGCIDAVRRYGTQHGSSRAYSQIDLYGQLESQLSEIFGGYALVLPSTTLIHQAVLPVMVDDRDAVIMDQHVHSSVQVASKLLKDRNIHIERLRHNDIERLEERIGELSRKFRKVWYLLDSVYSMYGDYAPLKELEELTLQHDQFNIYVDDAHGMSWEGKNGSGYAFSQLKLSEQVIITTSLNKAFAGTGGVAIFHNEQDYIKVRTVGGACVFSTPIPPPMLGVNLASANIHLSEEIIGLQNNLQSRIEYFSQLSDTFNLPLIQPSSSPIFYVGTGLPKVGFNLLKRIIDEGYYTGIGLFPAVGTAQSGLRICLTNHITNSDISGLIQSIDHHLPLAMEEEGRDYSDYQRFFKCSYRKSNDDKSTQQGLRINLFDSIEFVDPEIWDSHFEARGSFNWIGCKFLEDVYSQNELAEDNWVFKYLIITDDNDIPILLTFFTVTLCKEDLFSPDEVSRSIENQRKLDPYYLVSQYLMMGSPMTEGDHLFVNNTHPSHRAAFQKMLDIIQEISTQYNVENIMLRDFNANEPFLNNLISEGYAKIDLPETNVIPEGKLKWESKTEYFSKLSSNSKRNLNKDVYRHIHKFSVEFVQEGTDAEIEFWYELYKQVKDKSLALNTFDVPIKFFKLATKNPNWEIMLLRLVDEYDIDKKQMPVAVGLMYKTSVAYCPMLIGLDYRFIHTVKSYKQALYQATERAKNLKMKQVYFGLTASGAKRSYGAEQFEKVAFVQMSDTYNQSVITDHQPSVNETIPKEITI